MNVDGPRRLATDEQRERLNAAKNQGGCCAACGKVLGAGEPVYFERFVFWQVGPTRLTTQAPVGHECAAPATLARTTGQEPERCAGCMRGVFYRKPRANRHRPACSRRCRELARHADRPSRARGAR